MNFFVDFLLTIHLINVKNKEKQCFSIALLAIVVRDKTNIIQLVAGKLGDQVLDVLPLLATHPGLQAAVEQSHVVVEHLVAGEPVPEPLVHLAPGVLALDLHRLVGVQPGHVGGLKENPPLLGFVEAVGVVVPGDADVVLEGPRLLVLLLGVPVDPLAQQAGVDLLHPRVRDDLQLLLGSEKMRK